MLYHYTSISSLVQILENRSLKFNSLTNCDDLDEAESKDLGRIGKFVFVSCWTREAEESIPMWSQYSGNMSGVRIGMKEYPFLKRKYDNKHGLSFETFLDYEFYYNDNKMMFPPAQPKLIDVEYVEEAAKIYPSIVSEGTIEDVYRFIRGETAKCELSFEAVGKYKRTCWEFQHECRYKIFGTPMGLKDAETEDPQTSWNLQREYMRRIMDESYVPGYQSLFVDLDNDAINEMEIVYGPRMNESEKVLLTNYLETKGLKNNFRHSSLRIQ